MTDLQQWFSVSQFLAFEARLIDERRFDEWLELFADDAVYWVPVNPDGADPARDVSIVFDDRARIRERILRLSSGFAHSQEPPSRTCHHVGGVEVVGEDGGVLQVESSLLVDEVRRRKQSLYGARVSHELRPTDGGFRIRRKTVRLVESELFLGNVTFLL